MTSSNAASSLPAALAARAAAAEAAGETLPILFTGSSTTAGTGASQPGVSYVALVTERLLARWPHATCENLGIGGARATTYLPDVAGVIQRQPAAIVHMVGSNDYHAGVPPQEYGATMGDLLDRIDAGVAVPCQHVLVQAFTRLDVREPAWPWAAYGAELAALAAGHAHRMVLDVSQAFAEVGVAFRGDDRHDLVGRDDIHLTDRGHLFLADLVSEALGL